MKRILSLVFCAALIFTLSACSGGKRGGTDHEVDIEYYAKLGQISNVEFTLGDDIDETKAALSATVDDHDETLYFDFVSGDNTVMSNGSIYCCFKTDSKDSGLSLIAQCDNAYGFNIGDVSTQIRDAMSVLGYDAKERDAKNGEIYFLPGGSFTVLEYKISDNTVLFVFQEHALCATVIHN